MHTPILRSTYTCGDMLFLDNQQFPLAFSTTGLHIEFIDHTNVQSNVGNDVSDLRDYHQV
jgi:hypothetical protein